MQYCKGPDKLRITVLTVPVGDESSLYKMKPVCGYMLVVAEKEICNLLAGMSQVSDNYREGRRLQSHGVQAMQIRLLLDLPHCVGATRLILVRVPQ